MIFVRLFSIICGMIFGASMVLLFNHKIRANIAVRFPWCADHPRAYIGLVVLCALLALAVAYIISVRFV